MTDESLFDDPDVTTRPDPAERRAVRRHVLGGILQVIRARRAWSVNDGASHAGIAPMTWRRVEEGLDVRQRTLTALDGLLGQPFGTVRRALDDDLAMVQLVRFADIDTEGVDVADPAGFLAALAERFRSGTAPAVLASDVTAHSRPRDRAIERHSRAVSPETLASLAGIVPPMSDLTRAAELVERITRRTLTPALENAVAAILAAMPDLVTDRIQDSLPAVDVLAGSANRTLNQAAAEVAQLATDRAVEGWRAGGRDMVPEPRETARPDVPDHED